MHPYLVKMLCGESIIIIIIIIKDVKIFTKVVTGTSVFCIFGYQIEQQ